MIEVKLDNINKSYIFIGTVITEVVRARFCNYLKETNNSMLMREIEIKNHIEQISAIAYFSYHKGYDIKELNWNIIGFKDFMEFKNYIDNIK